MGATLASIRIQNLALVEDLRWEPGPGFVALTGETGAGKSVLIGALNLIVGSRADKGSIRSGASSSTVEAIFEGVEDPRISSILADAGVEPCEGGMLIIKRVIPNASGGKQFVNGSACTLSLLRKLGDLLVDLHGPHDHQSLLSRDNQTRVLDAYAGAIEFYQEFAAARSRRVAIENEAAALQADEQSALREIDLLEHQVEEIEQASLVAGEEDEVVNSVKTAQNLQRISELVASLEAAAGSEEGSLSDRIAAMVRSARELVSLTPEAAGVEEEAQALSAACDEFEHSLRGFASNLENVPQNFTELEQRLDLIGTLKRKYGSSVEEVIAFGMEAANQLERLRTRAERSAGMENEIRLARESESKAAQRLSRKRSQAAGKLQAAITQGLHDLGFLTAGFSVSLESLEPTGSLGSEVVDFLFAPNPGEEARPLRDIASSGEMSRVMLAIKGVLAQLDDVAVLVFDEIDANVGGEVATRVAKRMHDLSRGRQILCITHLPQVASTADQHFVVAKLVKEERTFTEIHQCQDASRIEELARMLGGKSSASVAHARDLLATSSAEA